MSDISDVVTGLSADGGAFVFSALVLVGAYFFFKQTFGVFLQKNIEQQSQLHQQILENMKEISKGMEKISEEIKETRESLIKGTVDFETKKISRLR